jgi:hypothetical protein
MSLQAATLCLLHLQQRKATIRERGAAVRKKCTLTPEASPATDERVARRRAQQVTLPASRRYTQHGAAAGAARCVQHTRSMPARGAQQLLRSHGAARR